MAQYDIVHHEIIPLIPSKPKWLFTLTQKVNILLGTSVLMTDSMGLLLKSQRIEYIFVSDIRTLKFYDCKITTM